MTKKKSNVLKLVLGVLVAAATGGAADAAGYTPDPAALKDLGIGGALMLILYIEYRAMPVLLRIAKMDPQRAVADEAGVELEVLVEEPAPKQKRAITQPHLVAVPPPAKEPR
jgi:hypothetical protein